VFFYGKEGLSFNKYRSISASKLLKEWQAQGDKRFFKLIISPEQAHRMSLKEHVKTVTSKIEEDLETKLEWASSDHHNTTNFHVHIKVSL
jgi:type IV secretory pathway VirD2 relaxase